MKRARRELHRFGLGFCVALGGALSACGSSNDSDRGATAQGTAGDETSVAGSTQNGGSTGVAGSSGANDGTANGATTNGGGANGGVSGASFGGASAASGAGSSVGGDGFAGSSVAGDANGGASAGAAGSTGSAGSGGASAGAMIHNDVFWKDTSGTPIYSQGGGVFKFGDTYYWYGVKYNGAVTYAANPSKSNSDTSFNAVTAYSSTDLLNWKFEANVLSATASGSEVAGASWFGRLGVAYNATTKKYVLVSQYSGTAGTGELFATSSTPTGSFTFDHIQATVANVANSTTGDQTVFVDDDGKAYLICSSSSGRSNLYVAPLHAADYLSVDPATRIFGGPGREGNAMFKYSGHYYFCSSDLHGWNASHTYCISATNIMGPYGAEFVLANTDADFSHVTQTGFFITVQGSAQSTVIFAGDRWADFAGNGLGFNQWMPLTFNGTTPAFQSLSEWSLDASTGNWSVGPDNNYALNPSFEADRVAMTVPAGWTTTGTTTNVKGGHTGNWSWQLTSTGTLEQKIANLPNGTYTLSVWAKSSGGQSSASVAVSNFGGTTKTVSLSGAIKNFTEESISGIAVTNGSAQINVSTTGSAAQSVTVDDFVLVRTGP
ncbi:MAG TPA: family 43 glycosylhydrolase [Polyangiaceae bacterium]|jgi:hypothetical protein|nr:family 43 glycosylhydrolase [Polyangiaceae bacterium]